MSTGKDIIQRLLDGEVPADERDEALRRIADDPALKREYDELSAAMRLLEEKGTVDAPPGFTASVMARIPQHAPSLGERAYRFLFGSRILRWNLASAAAAFALIMAVLFLAWPRERSSTLPLTASSQAAVTVRLSFYAPKAQQVSVAGDFNKWSMDSDRMVRQNGGIWTIDLVLRPGRYSYMFVLDGKTWMPDPGADSYQDDGFGNRNAVLRIST